MKTEFKSLLLPAGEATDMLLEKMFAEGWKMPGDPVFGGVVKPGFDEAHPGPRFLFLLKKRSFF